MDERPASRREVFLFIVLRWMMRILCIGGVIGLLGRAVLLGAIEPALVAVIPGAMLALDFFSPRLETATEHMTSTEQRLTLLRANSDADQLRAETEALAADELLDGDERERTAIFANDHRSGAGHSERLLLGWMLPNQIADDALLCAANRR